VPEGVDNEVSSANGSGYVVDIIFIAKFMG